MERASDGELSSPAERAAFQAHLRRCPACRERGRVHAAFADRLARSLIAEAEELAARAGRTAQLRAARFAQALHTRKQAHIHRRHNTRPMVRWIAVAALGPLIVIGLLLSRTHTAVVHADELLTRAEWRQRARPPGSMQRVRIRLTPAYASGGFEADAQAPRLRTASFLAIRELRNGVGTEPWPDSGGEEARAAAADLLARHGFDWRTPLRIEPVRAWRARLREKTDHVTPLNAHELLLRTSTPEGELREIQVTVRRETFHVTRQLFIFQAGRIEIEEVAGWVRETPPTLVADATPATAMPRPDADALSRAELDVRLLLHDAGADLGGLVRVSRGTTRVHVDGRVPSVSLRRRLQARLTSMPLVESAIAVGGDPLPDPADAAVASARPALGRWLDRTFGGEPSDAKATFVPRLERLVDIVGQRLDALDALAARYDATESARLSPAAEAKLQLLLDRQYAALNADLHALDARVAVLFGSAARPMPAASAPVDWARRVGAARRHARELARRLDLLLTREDLPSGEAPGDEARDGVARELAALWEALNAGVSSVPGRE